MSGRACGQACAMNLGGRLGMGRASGVYSDGAPMVGAGRVGR